MRTEQTRGRFGKHAFERGWMISFTSRGNWYDLEVGWMISFSSGGGLCLVFTQPSRSSLW